MTTDERIEILFLSKNDVETLALSADDVLGSVEAVVRAQGEGKVTLDPRVQHVPDPDYPGHFNVLRATVWPLGVTGVKVVGDYVENLPRRSPVRARPRHALRSADRRAARDRRCDGDHRAAYGRAYRTRCARAGAPRLEGARPHRRARHGVLERHAARQILRLRRDPRDEQASRVARARSRVSSRTLSASRSASRSRSRRRSSERTSSWRPRGSPSLSRCSRLRGSMRATSSSPTAR